MSGSWGRSKTLFTRNTPNRNNVFANATGTFELDPALRLVIEGLVPLVNLYKTGQYTELENTFTLDLYSQYSKKLFLLRKAANQDSELVRKGAIDTLTTLFSIVALQADYELTVESNERLREEVSILHDMDKLREYIEALNRNTGTDCFGEHDIEVTSLDVNLEYVIYCKKYGYPPNGVFDPNLLGEIMATL
jgi:hypothetical protein